MGYCEGLRQLKRLGAIIAGGLSTRFGSDKACALLNGTPLIEHVHSALSARTDHVVVCGRTWPGIEHLDDRPNADLGPLGGLCAALHFANRHGYDVVLSAPVDVHPFPDTSALMQSRTPRVFREQRLLGAWPSALASRLDDHIAAGHRSVRSWIAEAGAGIISDPIGLRNINTPDDLSGQ